MVAHCQRCKTPLNSRQDWPLCASCLLLGGRSDAPQNGPFLAPSLEDIGRCFPDLEVLALVGQGGMGAVYHARQRRLGREVALKILRPEAKEDPRFGERFLREARALARLSHPNIVGVYDFGLDGEFAWLTMEYVDGSDLRQVLTAGALPPADAFALVPQICEALQYAHDQGVVHRDIKPENILLDERGRVHIADFGLALVVDDGDRRLTQPRDVFGTPHYMAPEQLTGARDVDHRADIYALGAVLYELLTGELPLGRFEPPSKCAPGLDERIDDVVLRTLAKEPGSRYQSAHEMGTAVDRVSGNPEATRDRETPLAAPLSMSSVPTETPKHEEAMWSLLVLLSLVLGVIIAYASDNAFALVIPLFLPGCGFGAIMAEPDPPDEHQTVAVILLVAAVSIAIAGVVVQGEILMLTGLLGFGGGVIAGFEEERKNHRGPERGGSASSAAHRERANP
ncbi:MAG: serine/threonine-protein kinase [Planctomycetota bacterium]